MTTTNDLSGRLVVLRLEMGIPGSKSAISSEDAMGDEEVDSGSFHVSKDIFNSAALRKIRSADLNKRTFIKKKRGVPCELARGGYYPMPVGLIDEVEEMILKPYANETRPKLVQEFFAEYPNLKEEAKTRLGKHFDDGDYPPIERIEKAFYITWRWLEFALPTNALKAVSKTLYEKEKQKTLQMWEKARAQITTALRVEFQGLVEHMISRLNPKDGKKMVLRGDMAKPLTEYLSVFPFRNVTDDAQLSDLITKTRTMLKGVNPVDLQDDEIAAKARDQFDKLKKVVDKLVEEAPLRAITLE